MRQKYRINKILLTGALITLSTNAFTEINVDKSGGVLTVTSDINGTVIAKVVGPDDEVMVDETYSGSSFSWTPSGSDGAYRYDVRVIPDARNYNDTRAVELEKVFSEINSESEYAGGSLEVKNGQIAMTGEE